MKKFNFKLEAVLQLRKRHEEMMQKEFAEAMQEVRALENKIQSQEHELEILRSVNAQRGAIDVSRMIDNRRFVEHLYLEKSQMEHDLEERRRIASHKQFLLAQASKEREAMTRLKETQREKWRQEGLREEQKVLDEVALNMMRKGERV